MLINPQSFMNTRLLFFFFFILTKQSDDTNSGEENRNKISIEANLSLFFSAGTQIDDLISLRRIVSHEEVNSIVIDAICNPERADPLEAPFFFTWSPLFYLFTRGP